MALRYGKLPTEILDLDIDRFSLNCIIFSIGMKYEASLKKGRPLVLTTSADDDEGMELPKKLDAIFGKVSGPRTKVKRIKRK
jgi:hypothetical protein